MSDKENSLKLDLDFSKIDSIAKTVSGVIPLVIQDADSKDVLIIGYANKAALDHSLETGYATLWSTSRNELWEKGKTSGDRLKIVRIRINCEQNSLLFLVRPEGEGACHVKDKHGIANTTCFYRRLKSDGVTLDFINDAS